MTTLEKQELYKNVKIAEATITLRNDGIIEVNYKKQTEITVELQMRMLDIFIDICENTKRPFLFMAMDYVSLTKEAQVNSLKIESKSPSLATAVVAEHLAYRLIANFYTKIYKPKIPLKVFSNEPEATEWLKTFL